MSMYVDINMIVAPLGPARIYENEGPLLNFDIIKAILQIRHRNNYNVAEFVQISQECRLMPLGF